MQKIFSFLFIIGLIATANAQKPVQGQRSAEVLLRFQTGSAPVSYFLPTELKLRYFNKDNTAFRLRLGMNAKTNTYQMANTQGSVVSEIKTKDGFKLSFAPGYEKHFKGSKRLSPFIGGEFLFNFNGKASKTASNCGFANPTSLNIVAGDYYEYKYKPTWVIGLGAYMGADYYVAEHIYLGLEFGMGLFQYGYNGESTEKYSRLGAAPVVNKTLSSNNLQLFGVSNGGVRLGFIF